MSTSATPRTWTAEIEVAGETITALWSRNDLQKEQAKSAIAEVAELIQNGLADEGWVQLYKTTAKGTRKDQSWYVYELNGKIKAQR